MKRRKFTRPYRQNHDQIGLLASLALHGVLALLLVRTNAPHPPAVTTINVTIEPPQTQTKRPQIVSPSEQPPQTPIKSTQRLSDTDSKAEVEQIRRGDEGGIPGPKHKAPIAEQKTTASEASQVNQTEQQKEDSQQKPPTQPQDKQHPSPREQPRTSVAKRDLHLKDLKLDDSTLELKFSKPPKKRVSSEEQPQANSSKNLAEYQAFSRPPGSGAAFFASAGISDHLPNLPDGDITLLNAKANMYASFVRRVAIQVFTQLRSQGWERLSAQQIRQLSGFATVEAILTPDGRFVRAQLVESSGSDAFDSVLHTSATKGAADPNPPPGALAKDGHIHFIFKARSWTQIGVNRRSGAPVEQRWLLLATGLE